MGGAWIQWATSLYILWLCRALERGPREGEGATFFQSCRGHVVGDW